MKYISREQAAQQKLETASQQLRAERSKYSKHVSSLLGGFALVGTGIVVAESSNGYVGPGTVIVGGAALAYGAMKMILDEQVVATARQTKIVAYRELESTRTDPQLELPYIEYEPTQ